MPHRYRLLPLLLALLGIATPALSQTSPIPRIEAAERDFEQGVAAFQQADYVLALRHFRAAAERDSLHQKSTAAHLMAGKALYRLGRYAEATSWLDALINGYPSSSYLADAEQVREFALLAQQRQRETASVVNLGILLPLGQDDVILSQAMFNGIRLAVDQANGIEYIATDASGTPIAPNPDPVDPAPATFDEPASRTQYRMIFRDSNDTRDLAALVQELADAGADVIIGPLFSGEAEAAASGAERARIVLVAPLATDEVVSAGRRYVFQANPTFTMRGRLMARFAQRSLRLDSLAVVTQFGDDIGERIAEGFQEELLQTGDELRFLHYLDKEASWYNLPEELGADTLRDVKALYLPIGSENAPRLIGAALAGLERMGTNVRVLGNAEWHDLPVAFSASRYDATYTNDFFVDAARPEVQAFVGQYRTLTGEAPNRLGYTGYDVTRYLLQQFPAASRTTLQQALRAAPLYQGLGIRLDFRGGQVNEALYFMRYRNGQYELLL